MASNWAKVTSNCLEEMRTGSGKLSLLRAGTLNARKHHK